MIKLHWALLILYLTAAAGYGGWRGRDLWSGWGAWGVLLPLFAWEALKSIGEWRRKPQWVCVRFTLLKAAINIIDIGRSTGVPNQPLQQTAAASQPSDRIPIQRAAAPAELGRSATGG